MNSQMQPPPATLLDPTGDQILDVGSPAVDDTSLMAKFSIRSRGRHYHYRGYRYERLADAVAYARIVHSMPAQDVISSGGVDTVEWPDAADEELMAALSISFENGVYRFGGFRYDRLLDATNYAEHCKLRDAKMVPTVDGSGRDKRP